METDAGEDWRIDPVLREQCQPVVNLACKDVRAIELHKRRFKIAILINDGNVTQFNIISGTWR